MIGFKETASKAKRKIPWVSGKVFFQRVGILARTITQRDGSLERQVKREKLHRSSRN